MNNLVRIKRDDDGELTGNNDWHLVDPCNYQGNAALCTGEFFGGGESSVEFDMKTSMRGGVTCKSCLAIIKTYKAVKL